MGELLAILCFQALRLGAMEDCAEAAGQIARDAGTLVDDDPRHRLRGTLSLYARFLFVDGESFIRSDVADSGQQVAYLRCGVAVGADGEIVGVARVGPAEFCCDAGEARIEPSGGEVA